MPPSAPILSPGASSSAGPSFHDWPAFSQVAAQRIGRESVPTFDPSKGKFADSFLRLHDLDVAPRSFFNRSAAAAKALVRTAVEAARREDFSARPLDAAPL